MKKLNLIILLAGTMLSSQYAFSGCPSVIGCSSDDSCNCGNHSYEASPGIYYKCQNQAPATCEVPYDGYPCSRECDE